MDVPLQVSFRNMDHSDAVETRVCKRADRLERFYNHIIACRVMIEAPERHHRKGKLYHARLEIDVPGDKIIISRHPGDKHAHEDVYVTIRDAFDAAERQLEDFARKQRGQIKSHEEPLHGSVVRLFPEQGYGFISLSDGQEVYFHKNSVVNGGFDMMDVGNQVRLVVAEKESEHGSQASTVHLVGKHHPGP